MNTDALSVVLAGGGTAGHISPLLAIAGAVLEAGPGGPAPRRRHPRRHGDPAGARGRA